MNKNAFTLPITLFILSIALIVLTSSIYIYTKQIQFEKDLHDYYKRKINLNLERLK